MEDSKLGKLSEDEKQRIENLNSYGIISKTVEKRFDEIVLLAGLICSLPMVAISFIDQERQVFKSKIGINENEVPREKSFCNLCIQGNEALLVAGHALDEMVKKNSLKIFDPRIKIYFGVPLVSSQGFVVGTLSLMGSETREISERQINGINMLANQVNSILEDVKKINAITLKIREVAHEVSNQATVVSGSVYVLKDAVEKDDIKPELVSSNSNKIKNSVHNIIKSVKELRALI